MTRFEHCGICNERREAILLRHSKNVRLFFIQNRFKHLLIMLVMLKHEALFIFKYFIREIMFLNIDIFLRIISIRVLQPDPTRGRIKVQYCWIGSDFGTSAGFIANITFRSNLRKTNSDGSDVQAIE